MLRLTFTDAKKQTKVIGESNDAGELYNALYNHAKRLFIHPTIALPPMGINDPKASYIVGQTKDGCHYMLENIGETEPKKSVADAAGCNVCNTI